MFETLTDKLSKTLRNLRGVGKLSEDNISDALAEVRKALLSADVHFKTAREFVEVNKLLRSSMTNWLNYLEKEPPDLKRTSP